MQHKNLPFHFGRKYAGRALCAERNIPFIVKYADQEMSGSLEQLEYARDYMHAGPRGHQMLAGKILNERT
jgi:hypothetical protein